MERKLRLSKQKLREIAHEGLVMRAKSKFSEAELFEWRDRAKVLVKNIAGAPAEFDFEQSYDGAKTINCKKVSGPRSFLFIHARFLKELAQIMDATDLLEGEPKT